MKYVIAILTLLMSLQASAQLSVGSAGMTVLSGTPLAVDGLSLMPSTSLSLANNTLQKSLSAVTGSPGSINPVYQFVTPIQFSGTAGVNYLPTELNGYSESSLQLAYSSAINTALTVTTASTVNAMTHYITNTLTSQPVAVVTASALPDLIPILSTLPATQYGTTNFTIVVDVYELNAAPTSAAVSVYIAKDPLVVLSFTSSSVLVGGKTVQNGSWSFDSTDGDFYILTTTAGITGKGHKSFGLTGVLTPGNTKGSLAITSTIAGVNGGELKITNNSDADKVDYFKK
jgi:hypothetical protein